MSQLNFFFQNTDQVSVQVTKVASTSSVVAEDASHKSNGGRKTRDERQRLSNRQKLLLLKRHHSGYLKRPEILETVYSVEEDGDSSNIQAQHSNTIAQNK